MGGLSFSGVGSDVCSCGSDVSVVSVLLITLC